MARRDEEQLYVQSLASHSLQDAMTVADRKIEAGRNSGAAHLPLHPICRCLRAQKRWWSLSHP